MPISTALPSPNIEFYGNFRYPNLIVNSQVLTGCAVGNSFVRRHAGTGQGPRTVAPIISSGGGGVVGPDFRVIGGRPCARVTTGGTTASAGWTPDLWQTGFDDSVWNTGAKYAPDSVVAIWDFHVAMTQVASAGALDQTGFYFTPLIPLQAAFTTTAPGGATPAGGFGIFVNDDGGGSNQWEFISFDSLGGGGGILQRTVIGAAIVPDVTLWSSFRFTIVGAAAGRPAEVSLEVNRTSIVGVQALPFDDITLMRPNTLNAAASRFCLGHCLGAMAGAGYNWSLYARFGRFTAQGEEIQTA